MLLRSEFPNGVFGDPALYVYEINEKSALLVDCGDLSKLTPKQLLKVDYIFLSHCHIDHFFGFDTFLRIHVGTEKKIVIFGPPQTSDRVGGKLQGYTWNLIRDRDLEFEVIDLDESQGKKKITRFHAKDGFHPSQVREEAWSAELPALEVGIYRVHTTTLDHRTPSLAYSIEEKKTVQVNTEALDRLGLKAGSWIQTVKDFFIFNRTEPVTIDVPTVEGSLTRTFETAELARQILVPRQRHKIVYATDGAASDENRKKLVKLAEEADLFFSETCFLQRDFNLADETKHFTAKFVGELAAEAGVKTLVPFHFSKRYLQIADEVFAELQASSMRENQGLTTIIDLRKPFP